MNKRKTAAIAGVTYYIQEEQMRLEQDNLSQIPRHKIDPWTYYSRNTIAGLNNFVQCRASRKYRSCPDNTIPEKGRLLQRAKCLSMGLNRSVVRNDNNIIPAITQKRKT